MLVAMRTMLALALVATSTARAESVSSLQAALPAGWKVVRTSEALTIERARPVKVAGQYLANAHYTNVPVQAAPTAPEIKLRLRYRIEPAWSAAKLSQATTENTRLYATLPTLRTRYQIDDIRTGKGRPLPSTPDEERRLREYQAAYDKTLAAVVRLPRCTIDLGNGRASLFDDETTYDQLSLMVDPPIAMRETFAIVELVKRRCR